MMRRGMIDILYKLVGETITFKTPILTETASNMRKEKFLVIQAYPYHVLCERTCPNGATIRECFGVGTLRQEGVI